MQQEIISFGSLFIGVGTMAVLFVLAYWFAQIARMYRTMADTDERYGTFEQMVLGAFAKKKGYDIEKELVERSIRQSKSFRGKVKEQMLKSVFPSTQEGR